MPTFRTTWQFTLFWLVSMALVTLAFCVALLTFGRGQRILRPMVRLWGRSCLAIAGVELQLDGGEELARRSRRVIVFNHASLLDLFVLCAVLPEGGVPVIKREIFYYPFLGWAVWLLRFVAIDRGNRQRAHASIERAAERIRREEISVLISPEGTRTRDGNLGRFKLGPLHLARAAEAPIVPLVIHGAWELMPYGRLGSKAGVVRLELLPPVQPDSQDFHVAAEELRGVFAKALSRPAGPALAS